MVHSRSNTLNRRLCHCKHLDLSFNINVGANFFLLFFFFSLTCYRVFFFFSLSGILLITLLCYVLYVNFVIVYYLALIYYQFYGSISVTTFVEVGFFLGGPDHQPRLPQHLVSSFVFHRFFINFILQSLKSSVSVL